MIDPIVAGFGLATLGTLTIAVKVNCSPPYKHQDMMGLAGMLSVLWLASNVLYALGSPPQSMALYPILDLAALVTVLLTWFARKDAWKMILAGLFVLQLTLHVAFWSNIVQVEVHQKMNWWVGYSYVFGLNVSYACQLLCIAIPGAWNLVGAWFGDHLPAPRGLGGKPLFRA